MGVLHYLAFDIRRKHQGPSKPSKSSVFVAFLLRTGLVTVNLGK